MAKGVDSRMCPMWVYVCVCVCVIHSDPSSVIVDHELCECVGEWLYSSQWLRECCQYIKPVFHREVRLLTETAFLPPLLIIFIQMSFFRFVLQHSSPPSSV